MTEMTWAMEAIDNVILIDSEAFALSFPNIASSVSQSVCLRGYLVSLSKGLFKNCVRLLVGGGDLSPTLEI